MKKSIALAFAAAASIFAGSPAHADVFGLQATTGRILTINPLTGAVTNSFATPAAIASTQNFGGLSYAAPLGQLLYFNSSASTTLYRLDPNTGAVITTSTGDSFANSGLSYEQIAGTNYLYYDHTNVDVHRQTNFGGAESFFFTPGTSTGGLGGDGYGREFGIFSDGTIHEYNLSSGALINSFATPTGALGLAYDSAFLYVSTSAGQLLTLNANTGAIVNTVAVAGGSLVELGARLTQPAAVPEPAPLALFAIGIAAVVAARRRRR